MNVTSGNLGTVPFTVKGAASQTADLQQWNNSSGTVLSKIRSDGQFYGYGSQYGGSQYGSIGALGLAVGGQSGETSIHYAGGSLTVRSSTTGESSSGSAWTNNTSALIGTGYAGGIGLIIKSVASQTADLQQWQNSAGTVLAKIDASGIGTFAQASFAGGAATIDGGGGAALGAIYTGALKGSPTAYNFFSNVTGSPYATVVVKGLSGQTTNLQEWQNSSGTALSYITKDGTLDLRNTSTTAFTNSNSGTVGPKIDLWGGQYGIGIAVGRMSFFIPSSGGIALKRDSYSGTSVFDVAYSGAASIFLQSASAVGLIVRGAASQTADLQQWQQSDGTVTSYVGGDGNIFVQNARALFVNSGYIGSASLVTKAAGPTWSGLIVKGATSQTANLQEWQDSTGTWLTSINSNGRLFLPRAEGIQFVGSPTALRARIYSDIANRLIFETANSGYMSLEPTGALFISSSPDSSKLIIRASTSQTVDIQQWQDGYSSVLAKVGSSGSQAVNLQEWQNNAGTILLSITPDGSIKGGNSNTISVNTASTVDTVALSSFTSMEYTLSIKQGSKIRSSKVLVHTDGTSVDSTEYGIMEMGGGITGILVTASVSSTNAILQVTITDAATTNATVKLIKTML